MILTFVLWLPNLLTSSDALLSLQTVLRTLAFLAVFAVIRVANDFDDQVTKYLLRAFVVSSALMGAFALYTLFVGSELYWLARLRGWTPMSARTELKGFAALAVLSMPVFLLAMHQLGGYWRAFALIAVLANLAIVWETVNRSVIASLLAGIVAVLALFSWGRSARLVTVCLGIGIGSAVLIVYWLSLARMPINVPAGDWVFPTWLIDYERQTMWRHVWNIAMESPWFGIGVNTINLTPGADVIIPGTNDTHIIPSHPHNWMIEVLAETGVFGLFSLCGLIALSGYQIIRSYFADRHPAWLAAAGVAVGYWTSGLFNFSFWAAWWQLSFLIILAICVAEASRPVSDDLRQNRENS